MSALALRILACLCMLLDHLGYCIPRLRALRYIGRLAFPLFVFLMVNGYTHTSSRLRYALRFGLFALLSQVPFTLFCGYGSYFEKWNVFFTLLCGLLTLWATDTLLKNKITRWFSFVPGLFMAGLFYCGILSADYGLKGILLALVFRYLLSYRLLTVLGSFVAIYFPQLLALGIALVKLCLGQEAVFSRPDVWNQTQIFSLLALVFIFLYNGKKGPAPASLPGKKALQWGFYLFYPLHLLLLYLFA